MARNAEIRSYPSPWRMAMALPATHWWVDVRKSMPLNIGRAGVGRRRQPANHAPTGRLMTPVATTSSVRTTTDAIHAAPARRRRVDTRAVAVDGIR